jgi:hypothetical protein
MTRDRGNKLWTTYETGNNPNQLVFTPDYDWGGGAEVRLGRSFCCGCYALELVFWNLDDITGSTDFNAADNGLASVSTPLNVSLPAVEFLSDGSSLDAYFDAAAEHRVRSSSDFVNVELNFLGSQGGCGRVRASWLGGIRYLRFRDNLLFGTVQGGSAFGVDPTTEAYIESDVENNLLGFQIGGRGDYYVTSCWSAFVAPTIGIYGNQIDQDSAIYRGDGELATNIDSNTTLEFQSDKTDFAMLGQLDVGLAYTWCNWRIFGGYRAVAMSGVALAENQIPFYVGDAAEWLDIDSNGHVILHGAFAGAEFRF